MRKLNKEQIIDIIYGSTLLGAGGGGTLTLAMRMLEELEKTHPIEVEMIEVDEMEDEKLGCMIAGMGSPVSLEEKGFGADAIHAFRGLKEALAKDGKDLAYTYSGEYGGLSTFVSIYVAILCDVPFVNLDGNGRAVPEMGTTLLPLYGYPSSPFALANENGDVAIIRTADPCDTKSCENFARSLCVAHGMKIGFASWPVDKANAKGRMICGGIDRLLDVGRAIRQAAADGTDPVEVIIAGSECRELFRGKVTKADTVAKDGFDFGVTYFETKNGETSVSFKNENMLAKDAAGNVLITVPELICFIDLDNCMPLNNAATKVGMNIAVLAFPAADEWWNAKDGFNCWRHILEGIGYSGDAVRY